MYVFVWLFTVHNHDATVHGKRMPKSLDFNLSRAAPMKELTCSQNLLYSLWAGEHPKPRTQTPWVRAF